MTKTETALTSFGSIPFSEAALAKPKKREGKFLPRLEYLSNAMCKLVQEGKAKAGGWALVDGGTVTDLGDKVTVIPLVKLDKAVDNSGEDFIAAYGIGTDEYERIAAEVDENGYDSGCMYGPYYLLFLADTEQFVELYLKSVSGRNEADNIDTFLPVSEEAAKQFGIEARAPRPAVLGSKSVTTKNKKTKKEYTYGVPTTSELPEGETLNVENPPEPAEVVERCTKFAAQAIVEDVPERESNR